MVRSACSRSVDSSESVLSVSWMASCNMYILEGYSANVIITELLTAIFKKNVTNCVRPAVFGSMTTGMLPFVLCS